MIRKIYNVLPLLLLTVATAVAQDATVTDPATLKNKKGEAYLPVADEWGLGVSASPFLGYLGNFMTNTNNNGAPDFQYGSNPTDNFAIYGKKMVDANTAYRVRFNVSVGSVIRKEVIQQDLVNPPDPAYPAFAEDWMRTNSTTIVIAPGFEKRRGSTRLQGVYGGELVIGYSSAKNVYQYGNSMTSDFPVPSSTNFNGNIIGGTRITENKSGGSFLVGARGFIGVEYFFAPKMSIGGEFGYMLAFSKQGRGLVTAETWDGANNGIVTTKVDVYNNDGLQSAGIGIDNLSGSINLLFYF